MVWVESLDLQILRRVGNIPTAPFFEEKICTEAQRIVQKLFPSGHKHKVSPFKDEFGNFFVHYSGDHNRTHPKVLAYVVHMDHPAFHVSYDNNNNRYVATLMGGLNTDLLPHNVPILLHGQGESARGRLTEAVPDDEKKYVIDTEERGEFQFATLDLPPLEVRQSYISGPALDDLASIGMSLAALKQISAQHLDVDVYVILHRAEEVGFIGAYGVASRGIFPKEAMVVSVETSSYLAKRDRKDPSCPVDRIVEPGRGIVIRTGDNITPAFNVETLHVLREGALRAQQEEVVVQQQRMYGGSCEAALYHAFGYRAAGMCIPLFAWHNNGVLEGETNFKSEVVHIDDFHGGTKVLVQMAQVASDRPELYRTLGRADITPDQLQLVESVRKEFEKYRKMRLI